MESSTCKIFVEHALHVARSLEPRPNGRGLGFGGLSYDRQFIDKRMFALEKPD